MSLVILLSVKVLFGHVHSLWPAASKKAVHPHLRMFTPPGESVSRYACAYTQAAPYVVMQNTDADVRWSTGAGRDRLVDKGDVAKVWP